MIVLKEAKRWRYWQPKKRYLIDDQWVDCPMNPVRLPDDDSWPVVALRLNDELDKWRAGKIVKKGPAPETVSWLIAEYKRDAVFKGLAPSTQKLYGYYFPVIEEFIGDIPANKVSRAQARDIYNTFVDTHIRKASQIVQVARPLFNFGRDVYPNLITENPFEGMGVKKAKPRQTIVPAEAIETAKIKAIGMGLKSVAYAIQLGYDAGQRPGDIRMLQRKDYDGEWLRVRQSKTSAVVDIPVYKMPALKAMLDQLGHDSTLILHEERTGQPYSKDMLCRRVREVFIAAGIGGDIQFRDLRRTAVVRLAEAGCEIAEICAITGHSLREATQILEVYLPRTRRMAENAADKVQKLEPR